MYSTYKFEKHNKVNIYGPPVSIQKYVNEYLMTDKKRVDITKTRKYDNCWTKMQVRSKRK